MSEKVSFVQDFFGESPIYSFENQSHGISTYNSISYIPEDNEGSKDEYLVAGSPDFEVEDMDRTEVAFNLKEASFDVDAEELVEELESDDVKEQKETKSDSIDFKSVRGEMKPIYGMDR